ncbi:MAG: hypothetical protein AAF697_07790 [Pseudomonadota bacterium]
MSRGIADTRVALGFAGAVIVLAVVGATSMDYLVPAFQDEEAEEQVAEGAPETAPSPRAEPTPVTTWADDGSVADDWGAAAAATPTNSRGFVNGSRGGSGEIEGSFGGFSPQASGSSQSSQPGGPRSSRTARGGGGSRIASGAAPGAPRVGPPGGAAEAPLASRR